MRGDSPIQKLGVERFADDKVEPLFTGRQRLDGLGKFAGDKADQGQFGVFLQRLVRRAGRLWLGLAAIGGVSRARENGNLFIRGKVDQRPLGRTKRSEEHTSELQSHSELVCRLLL